MKSGIYKITNIKTRKFYIGSSKNIEYRWNEHKQWLRGNYHINPKLQHAWNKYKEDTFLFEIIEETSNDQQTLFNRENYYLSTLKPYERNVGYNICPKAEGGDNITHNPNRDKFIQKMLIVNKGENNGMFGKKHKNSTINEMKSKSIDRYTLEWFIDKYGQKEGESKFNERNEHLRNRRINYSYDNKCSGKKRGPMSEEIKKRISERKRHLNIIREELHKDILSNLFTIPQLENKYKTSKTTILREKKKLVNNA